MIRIIEAFVVGIMTIIIGSIIGAIIGIFFSVNLPSVCKKWNKYHAMEISLFLTGFILYLICELIKQSRWYKKYVNL